MESPELAEPARTTAGADARAASEPALPARGGWPLVLGTTAAVLVADQVTKALATRLLAPRPEVELLGPFVRLTYVRNPGAAFGVSVPGRWTLGVISLLAALFILGYCWKAMPAWKPGRAAYALLLGGALGNLIDRWRFGEVVDFFQVGVPPYYWPVFNVADSAVTVGACLLLLGILRRRL